MKRSIKIESVEGISYGRQCQLIENYIDFHNKDGEPIQTKKGTGINIKLPRHNRSYHIGCHSTKTMHVFKIWRGI